MSAAARPEAVPTFGPYRLLELLGRGGMGEVYRAYDTATDRTVALKLLPPRLSADGHYAARFRRECRVAARLNEAHVVPIHGFGEIDGRLYLDMRLVDGVDLAAWLRVHGPLPPEAAVAVVSQVARALDAAHANRLVHRDVKPSNILLADLAMPPLDPATLFAYLFDFGIARPLAGAVGPEAVALTRAGAVPGSPRYVAPERFSGVEGRPAADVYSLGCVLHEALTGKPPFTGDLPALMRAHVHDPPPRPSAARPGLPAPFDRVVARGMAKEPRLRYRTAGELAAAGRRALGPDLGQVRTIRSSSTMASAATVAPAQPDAGADTITVRFGGTPPPAHRRLPRRHRRALGGTGVAGSVVAAMLAFVLLRPSAPLEVTSASVAAVAPGRACDVAVDIVGTVRTNGSAGTVTYQWTRSDGETSAPLSEIVGDGRTSVDVHLLWTVSGRGRFEGTATLRILEPTPKETAGSFRYDCRRR